MVFDVLGGVRFNMGVSSYAGETNPISLPHGRQFYLKKLRCVQAVGRSRSRNTDRYTRKRVNR